MDYEKKYKEAVCNIQKLLENGRKEGEVICAYEADFMSIFPELKESEDERIRKALIKGFNECLISSSHYPENAVKYWHGIVIDDILSWLEKQGEKKLLDYDDFGFKPAIEVTTEEKIDNANKVEPKDYNDIDPHFGKPIDKVEPKFKVRNWYQCTKDFFGKGVTFDKNTAYYCAKEGCLQNEYGCHIAIVKDLYDNFKLWNIADAKDGDVLVASDGSIFLFAGVVDCACKYYVALTACNDVKINKEVDGGYWETSRAVHPATKEQRDLLFQKMHEEGYEWDAEKKEPKKIEQKPEWSEVDENHIQHISDFIMRNRVGDTDAIYRLEQDVNWLKSLKNRVQPKQEWSEEVEAAITLLKDIAEEQEKDYCPHNANDLRKAAQYLETCRPQNTWKPSDEQIDALDFAADCIVPAEFCVKRKVLKELLEQLKKLREE